MISLSLGFVLPQNDQNYTYYVILRSKYDQNWGLARDTSSNLLRNGHLTSPQIEYTSKASEWPQTHEQDVLDINISDCFISGFVFAQNWPEIHNLRDFKEIFAQELSSFISQSYLLKIVKSTMLNQFFELDNEQDYFWKRETCSIQLNKF